MNKFKSLLLLCMVFAFASMSNQGYCNGDPVAAFDLADCTTTITSTSEECAVDDLTYTLSVTVSTTNAETVAVTVTGTAGAAYGPTTVNGTYTGGVVTVDFPSIPDGTTAVSISALSSGSACGTPTTATTGSATHSTCASGCQNCFEVDAMIQDENDSAEGGEVCGTVTETFEVGNDLTANGTIGSATLPNRNVTFEFGNSATMTGGFEVFAGSEFLCTNAPISCAATLAPESETTFSAPVTVDAQVKIMPNPVTNIARIQYNIAQEGAVQVAVFDMKGNQVAVVANGTQASGMHTVEFNSSNLSAGFYYLTVRTANSQTTERLVIVK